jgi:hypothetical protein
MINKNYAGILKAHSLTLTQWVEVESELLSSVNAVFEAGGLVSYLTMWLLTLHFQLFKNSTDTQGKLRLNLHSLSVSVSELSEYGR